jgi:hypothetical protein
LTLCKNRMLANLFNFNNNNNVDIDNDSESDDGGRLVHPSFREVSSSRLWSSSNTTSKTNTFTDADFPRIESVEIISSPLVYDYEDEGDDCDRDDSSEEGEAQNIASLPPTKITNNRRQHGRQRKCVMALLSCMLLSMIVIHVLQTSKHAKRKIRFQQFKARIAQLSGYTSFTHEEEENFLDENSPQYLNRP